MNQKRTKNFYFIQQTDCSMINLSNTQIFGQQMANIFYNWMHLQNLSTAINMHLNALKLLFAHQNATIPLLPGVLGLSLNVEC